MAYIKRFESYNGNTTPTVQWHVMFNGKLMRECTTKREALKWLPIYNTLEAM